MQTSEDMGVLGKTAHQLGPGTSGCWPSTDPHLTLNTCAHTRLEDLARVVDSLPTSELWAGDPLCDTAHILPTDGVSAGLNGAVGNQPDMRPEASRQAPDNPPFKLPGQDSNLEKQDQNLL